MPTPLRILVITAHPDDCELKAGGVTALYRAAGHRVKFVSVTNGESGHHRHLPGQLAAIRRAECDAVAELMGIEYDVLDNRDGRLQPTVEPRFEIIALIRRYQPDLILTHRPNDYHPDHRATSTLVCDAAYMVIVPHIVPEAPALRVNPVIAYLSDHFQKPVPFAPTVVIDVEPVLEKIVDQLECHKSQFHEWMPWTMCLENSMPRDAAGLRKATHDLYCRFNGPLADSHRDLVIATYGPDRGAKIRYIEAFEPCEYGSPLTEANRKTLFPMLP
ncbi:MAG: PIG-L deacetylase family protein [Planctomycetaceae bacterium]|nr:PIG-L deacetylase family protein [Planctomycetaceae bacterium]